MKPASNSSSGSRLAGWLAGAGLACGILNFGSSASAQIVTLTSGNSSSQIDLGSQTGMFNWIIDGVNVLNQQSFFFRTNPAEFARLGRVALQLNGSVRATTLVGAAIGLYNQGYAPVAALVLVTTLLVPLFQISGLLYVLVPLRKGRRAPGQNELFRALTHMRPWAMSEVFMLGALVALVKLSALAEVIPGVSLFSYGALMLALSALTSITPTEQFWRWVDGGGQ